MKVFVLSDLHVDYAENALWISDLSAEEFQDDLLILAGDISDVPELLARTFTILVSKFHKVLFVPGNHELWVHRCGSRDSFDKFALIQSIAQDHGVITGPFHQQKLSIIPLLAWYDYSFAQVSEELQNRWMDFSSCLWRGLEDKAVTEYFCKLNEGQLGITNVNLISFSHFVPRIDLLPEFVPEKHRIIYPVLGSTQLEGQIRLLKPDIHVYGHSHVNRDLSIDGIRYVNNAFGNPGESRIAAKALRCIYEE